MLAKFALDAAARALSAGAANRDWLPPSDGDSGAGLTDPSLVNAPLNAMMVPAVTKGTAWA